MILEPSAADLANERASEPTRAERGSRGPRERACRGVRGAKPFGPIEETRDKARALLTALAMAEAGL